MCTSTKSQYTIRKQLCKCSFTTKMQIELYDRNGCRSSKKSIVMLSNIIIIIMFYVYSAFQEFIK